MLTEWRDYYKRTQELPTPRQTKKFLALLPPDARILDFGCGSGRWAKAFARDRPDVVIDLIDRNLPDELLASPALKGEKYRMDFRDFFPRYAYYGIWANNSLFFMAGRDVGGSLHRLSEGLVSKGVLAFSMVLDGEAARAAKFAGMKLDALDATLEQGRLKPISIILDENVQYGDPPFRVIPTFYVYAQKIGPG